MIIADHDKDMMSNNVTNLSFYKEQGTEYTFGKEITKVIDTVHHTHSHHSRLIQLADIYTYSMALYMQPNLNYPKQRIIDYIKDNTNVGFPSKYKFWPSDQCWHKP